MIILDGKEISKQNKLKLKEEVKQLIETHHVVPNLTIIQVGNNPASDIYVRNKTKAASFCNMSATLVHFEETVTQEEMKNKIEELNNDKLVHGIIVQLPLPAHLNEQVIIDSINVTKDVDGFGVLNRGRMFSGLPSLAPGTPAGIIKLLDAYGIEIQGKEAVVVGRSNIVGKPMAMLLLNRHATVTIAHSRTTNLKDVTRRADILVVAIGKKQFITADMVKPGAVVIDVGINRDNDKLYGDVDFEHVAPIVSYITPVPGGVGPLTIATLLENTVSAYKEQINK